jgi:very-short-patch-repair endonuclease
MKTRKWDILKIKEYVESRGYELLSNEYLGYSKKIHLKCKEGHEFFMAFSNFKNGQNCPECYQTKWDTSKVSELVKSKGCELLSEYISYSDKLKLKCRCGNIFYVSTGSFKDKNVTCCSDCSKENIRNKLKTNIEDVKSAILNLGCEWIGNDSEYNNYKSKLTIKCSCGEVFNVSFGNLLKSKRCKKCNIKNRTLLFKDKRFSSIDKIKYFFNSYGVDFIDGYYNNNTDNNFKLKCKCCGEEYEQKIASFLNSPYKMCQKCSKEVACDKTRYKSDYIESFIEENSKNLWINKDDFKNINTSKLKLKCKCGNEYTTGFYSFKTSKHKVCEKCLDDLFGSKFKDIEDIITYIRYNYSNVEIIDIIDNNPNVIPKLRYSFKLKYNEVIKILSFKTILYYGLNFSNLSKIEVEICDILNKNNIDYIYNHSFENLKYKNKLRVDFYLPDYNICIEADGLQHIKRNKYFHKTEEDFISSINRDKIKDEYFLKNNIKLIRIPCYKTDKTYIKNKVMEYIGFLCKSGEGQI